MLGSVFELMKLEALKESRVLEKKSVYKCIRTSKLELSFID